MTQPPPEDPHSAETKFSAPLGGPPGGPPPPYTPPYAAPTQPPAYQAPPQQGWAQPPPPQQQPSWGSPPAGPPGYGGYGGSVAPTPRSKLPWILGAVLVVLLLIGGGLTAGLLLSGDDETTSASDPVTVADPTEDPTDEPTDEPTAEEPTASSAPAAPEPDPEPVDVSAVVGFWNGTYECAQGATVLDLTIAPSGEGDGLDAVFEFSATEDNPGTATGSYLMEGTFTDGVLELTGTDWIDDPGLYTQVGLTATVTESYPSSITGEVTDPSCTTFSITR